MRKAVYILGALLILSTPAKSARIEDLSFLEGPRENQLVGYGIVVGLSGTGDRSDPSTEKSLANMLTRFGLVISAQDLKSRNAASVLVTATLPTFPVPGRSMDVVVSSIGDATSLEGGVLLRTPLHGTEGDLRALAQGSVLTGGRHSTSGRIPGGARGEGAEIQPFVKDGTIRLFLNQPNFQTARRLEEAISAKFGSSIARAENGSSVKVAIPNEFKEDPVAFVAQVGGIEVAPDEVARVVIQEKTGAVVIGGRTRLLPAAVSIGNLEISIASNPAFRSVEGDTLQDLVEALNSLGTSPQQLIEVLKSLHSAGVLMAELQVL